MKSNIIYLTGFMGSGKSTIGPILANTLGWGFYDLDSLIEGKTGMKVRTIFEEKGEQFFRELESQTLSCLSKQQKIVVSLGGGTMIREINREVMKNTGVVIYLKVSNSAVYKRLRFKRDRPVLLSENGEVLSKDELVKKIENLFKKRKEFYEQADIIIDTELASVGVTVDKITNIIMKQFNNINNKSSTT